MPKSSAHFKGLVKLQLYYLVSSVGKSSQLSQNPSKQNLIRSSVFVDSFPQNKVHGCLEKSC